jgi:hypothetical protein
MHASKVTNSRLLSVSANCIRLDRKASSDIMRCVWVVRPIIKPFSSQLYMFSQVMLCFSIPVHNYLKISNRNLIRTLKNTYLIVESCHKWYIIGFDSSTVNCSKIFGMELFPVSSMEHRYPVLINWMPTHFLCNIMNQLTCRWYIPLRKSINPVYYNSFLGVGKALS